MEEHHQKNSLLCAVDMLDITERHGSNLRLKPQGGHPFWITVDDLPKKVRDHAQHMEAKLVLVGKKGDKPDKPLHDGMTAANFRKLLAGGCKLRAA